MKYEEIQIWEVWRKMHSPVWKVAHTIMVTGQEENCFPKDLVTWFGDGFYNQLWQVKWEPHSLTERRRTETSKLF